MNANKMSLTIFLDLRKAFDTVDHDILTKNLNWYGVVHRVRGWFEFYLKNRTQFCTLSGNKPKPKKSHAVYTSGFLLRPSSIYNLPK